jgi:hypothetical protein
MNAEHVYFGRIDGYIICTKVMLTVNHYWDETKSSESGGNIWKKSGRKRKKKRKKEKGSKKDRYIRIFFQIYKFEPMEETVQSNQNALLTFPLFPPEILNITKKTKSFISDDYNRIKIAYKNGPNKINLVK